MISLSAGLKQSLLVLEHLRDNEDLKDIHINVGTFTNCRECGLTFMMMEGAESFTWCVYEHRNSDSIIVNGKKGYVSMNGELPYKADSKHDYLADFDYDQSMKCADYLVEQFKQFHEANNNKGAVKV